jgi:predicted NAD-dependent protein-ADP-ribosyltransferase YbiA (DUF1768 family)
VPDGVLVTADFPNVEVFFQADKSATEEGYKLVLEAARRNTWHAKAAGQRVPMREDWESGARIQSMMTALRAKADQVPYYRNMLVMSGHRFIAEDSPTDAVWGLRYGSTWDGRNLLGLCHMIVRAERFDWSEFDKVAMINKLATCEEDRINLLKVVL